LTSSQFAAAPSSSHAPNARTVIGVALLMLDCARDTRLC
jgi:hypothetical protein